MSGFAEPRHSKWAAVHFVVPALVFLLGGLCDSASAQEATTSSGEELSGTEAPTSLAPPISLIPSQGLTDRPGEASGFDIVSEGVIAVRMLDDVSTDSIGLIDALSGGFPVDMWAGTPKDMVDILWQSLPRGIPSHMARDLAQRLLLSVAQPPILGIEQEDIRVDLTAIVPSAIGFVPMDGSKVQTDTDLSNSVSEPTFGILEGRLAQLAAMGDWRNVRALVELIPEPSQTPNIRKLATDLALIEGGVDAACAEAGENLSVSEDVYWQKVFAFCQLRDGNVVGAFLTIDLLRELGVDDPTFFWVAEIMAGNRPITPNGMSLLTPLQLAMLRGARRPFPTQLVRQGDPTVLRVLAEAEPLYVIEEDDEEEILAERLRRALDLRLNAAERAVRLGALDPEVLRSHYRAEVFGDGRVQGELATAGNTSITAADSLLPSELIQQAPVAAKDLDPGLDIDLSDLPVNTPLARARLFKLAEGQRIPTARAEVISRAIDYARADRGRNGPDVGTVGLIYGPLLRSLMPTGELNWFAGNAARALIGSGDVTNGLKWLELTRLYARTSIEASDVAAAMWPIERQLQPAMTNRFTPLRFKRWEETRPPGLVADDKTLILTTFSSLGETVNNADWLSLMDRQPRRSTVLPSPHIWNGLDDASTNGRVAETVLLTLISMGDATPAEVSPVTLSHIISSLMQIGLERDARRLAVEAAIIRGL